MCRIPLLVFLRTVLLNQGGYRRLWWKMISWGMRLRGWRMRRIWFWVSIRICPRLLRVMPSYRQTIIRDSTSVSSRSGNLYKTLINSYPPQMDNNKNPPASLASANNATWGPSTSAISPPLTAIETPVNNKPNAVQEPPYNPQRPCSETCANP